MTKVSPGPPMPPLVSPRPSWMLLSSPNLTGAYTSAQRLHHCQQDSRESPSVCRQSDGVTTAAGHLQHTHARSAQLSMWSRKVDGGDKRSYNN